MIPDLTLAGATHVTLAVLCAVAGFIQFLRPKRGAGHRARGYFYVYAMLVADGTAMLVYRFSGHFNLFHVAAIINFACIVLAMVPLLRSPRPANWRTTTITSSPGPYMPLMSAAAINIVVRLLPLTTREQTGLTALVVSIVTMVMAYILIGKYRPRPEAPSVSGKLVEQSGVPS